MRYSLKKCARRGLMPAIALALSACGGSGGDTPDPVSPPPPPPPPVPTTLVIRGQVIDQPIANASITVNAGDQTYMTTANVNGQYEVALVMPPDDNAFVTLTATGTGPQAQAELTSLLGTAGTLMAQAGDDLSLSRDENANTNVTNLTTAEAVLVQQANGGNTPTTDSELAQALTQVDPVQALNIAAAIKLVIDNGVPLPAGVTSTLELAADAPTVNAFIAEQQAINGAAFEAALNDTVSNPAIVAVTSAATVPEFAYAIVSATTDPQTLFGGAANGSLAFRYAADGTGAFWTSNGFSDAMRWTLDGSDIVSTFTTNPSFTFTDFPRNPDNPAQQIRVVCTAETTEVRVRRLTGTSANVTQTATTTCDDERFNESGTSTSTLLFAERDDLETLTADELANAGLTLTIYEPSFDNGNPGDDPMATDIVDLLPAGTGSTRLRGRTLTWSIVDGSLVVNYSTGVTATYTLVRDFTNNGGLLLADFQRPDGERRVAGSITFRAANDPSTVPPIGPGTYYQYGVGAATSEGTDPRLKGFAIELDNGGLAAQFSDAINPDGVRRVEGSFSRSAIGISDRGLRIDQPFALDTGTFDPVRCPAGNTLPNCIVLDRRDVFPVAASADGGTLYVVERRQTDFVNGISTATQPTFFSRFYEVAPNGDYALDRTDAPPAEPVRGPATRLFAPKAEPAAR